MNARARLSISLLSALACGAGALPASAAAQTPDDLREARTRGSATAPVTMYIMSDFECPYCGDFARGTFQTIEREYVETGRMKVVFVNFPLTSIHPNAEPAAEVAMCAARQNKFWAMHDLLFRHQERLKERRLHRYADELELDIVRFEADMKEQAYLQRIREHIDEARKSGARGTPTFFLNDRIFDVSFGLQRLHDTVEKLTGA